MSLFLTKEEVAQLTGKLRPSAQIRELKARGIAHTVNARREPVVTCEAVRLYHHLTAGAPLSSGTPWFVEGQTVHEWLRVRRSEFLLSLEQIVARAIPHIFSIPPQECIYFLISAHVVVYVGLTNDVNRRLLEHSKKDFSHISVIPAPQDALRVLEKFYISRLRPRLNESIPPDADSVASLLEP